MMSRVKEVKKVMSRSITFKVKNFFFFYRKYKGVNKIRNFFQRKYEHGVRPAEQPRGRSGEPLVCEALERLLDSLFFSFSFA